jgi:hypothetical protein
MVNQIRNTTIFLNLVRLRRSIRGVCFNKVTHADREIYIYPLMRNINDALRTFTMSYILNDPKAKISYAEKFKGYMILVVFDTRDIFDNNVIHATKPKLPKEGTIEHMTNTANSNYVNRIKKKSFDPLKEVTRIKREIAEYLSNLEVDSDRWVNSVHSKFGQNED